MEDMYLFMLSTLVVLTVVPLRKRVHHNPTFLDQIPLPTIAQESVEEESLPTDPLSPPASLLDEVVSLPVEESFTPATEFTFQEETPSCPTLHHLIPDTSMVDAALFALPPIPSVEEMVVLAEAYRPEPEVDPFAPIDFNTLKIEELRKQAGLCGIKWRDAHGKNRHMKKTELVEALNCHMNELAGPHNIYNSFGGSHA